MSKRALSEVISVTLMVLIVIVVGVSIYSFSSKFIENQKEGTVYNPYLAASIDEVVIPGKELTSLSPAPLAADKVMISVTRLDNEEQNLKGIRFVFFNDVENTKIVDIEDPPVTGIPKIYEIESSDIGMDPLDIKKVSLSFILSNGKFTGLIAEKEV